jgi:hypothetical protein
VVDDGPIELHAAAHELTQPDNRPRIPEPLPVWLVAVDDVVRPAPLGIEETLDSFYVGLLGMVRSAAEGQLAYHADNFDLQFEMGPPPVEHPLLRPLGIQVPLLAAIESRLLEMEIPYSFQMGTTPGLESIILLDPAGNWVELTDRRVVG